MLKKVSIAAAALAMALSAGSANAASTVTFDPLSSGAVVSSYTEDGVSLASGNTNHFHVTADGSGGRAARFFQSDGFPFTFSFSGGVFALQSIDFLSFNDGIQAVFTSSSGAVQTVGTAGTVNFGSGFSGITSFVLSSANGGNDRSFVLDNVKLAGAVPEPATWVMMLLGFGAMGVSMRRHRKPLPAMQVA